MARTDTTTIIVGAGPAGVSLAYLLASRGVSVTLLEQHTDPEAKSKPRLNAANLSRRVRQYFKKQVDFLAGNPEEDTLPHLTPREHQVMTHLSRGALDKEIAEMLQISAWTVHNHLKNIYEKLGVQNRTEAVMEYLQK